MECRQTVLMIICSLIQKEYFLRYVKDIESADTVHISCEIYKATPYNQELLPKGLCSGPTKKQHEPFVPCQQKKGTCSREHLEKLVTDIANSTVLILTTLMNRTRYFKGTGSIYFVKVLLKSRDHI